MLEVKANDAVEAFITNEAVEANEALTAFCTNEAVAAYEALVAEVAEPDKLPVITTCVVEICIGNSFPKPSDTCFRVPPTTPLSPTLISASYVVLTFKPVNEVAIMD